CSDSFFLSIVICFVSFGFLHHTIDLVLRQTSLVIGDCNLVLLAGRFVLS
uniref:Uncharacterized protein n=1 Tax=Parascaris univalens TaxID=6257 RepID=A0A915CEQ6_PARUN